MLLKFTTEADTWMVPMWGNTFPFLLYVLTFLSNAQQNITKVMARFTLCMQIRLYLLKINIISMMSGWPSGLRRQTQGCSLLIDNEGEFWSSSEGVGSNPISDIYFIERIITYLKLFYQIFFVIFSLSLFSNLQFAFYKNKFLFYLITNIQLHYAFFSF